MAMADRRHDPASALRTSVHVWWVDPERVLRTHGSNWAHELLSDAERTRAARFTRERDRTTFTIAHALVRRCLSGHADVPPAAWRFEPNDRGRPEIAGPDGAPDLRFSLSHTPGLIAFALTAGAACGVDVECLTRRGDPLRVARRVLAPVELADLDSQPQADRRAHLLAYWTLKEAYLKACGIGLAVAMRDLTFAIEADRAILLRADATPAEPVERWRFERFRPTPSHTLAVAVGPTAGPSRTIRLREGLTDL
jgi:4'-phosphopantetheinyl transferase